MSKKRYQVFISSTFTDLKEERKSIMDAILNLDCFPSGMEMFPASDMEQFEYIKKVIEESDYYILIVAGRYGSVAEDGISYTEKEYDYARKKGIPILVFMKRDISSLAGDKIELDPDKRERLECFRDKISQNRLVKLWDDEKDLKYNVYDSLSKAIKMYERTGWIKGDATADTKLLRQINDLRIENENLKNKIENLEAESDKSTKYYIEPSSLAQGEDELEIKYDITFLFDSTYPLEEKEVITFTWNELFDNLGYHLLEPKFESDINEIINGIVLDKHFKYIHETYEVAPAHQSDTEVHIKERDIKVILLQFVHLNLLKIVDNGLYRLTEKGRHVVIDRMLIKKENEIVE